MALTRWARAFWVGLSTLIALAGCGEPTADDPHPLVAETSAPVVSSAPVDPSPPATPSPPTYEQMCRHYCETLVDTGFYSCVADGRGEAACRESRLDAELCVSLRCVPRLVQPSLCLQQCDALAVHYGAVCGQSDAPIGEPICPATPAASDEACRAGCALAPG